MALEQYWNVLKKWWWLMVASTLIAAGASYFSVSRQPRIYQATTTLMIGQGFMKANPTYQDFDISELLAQTYVNMVQRRPILEGAAEALGLSSAPWAGNVSAGVVPGTQLLQITVRDTLPERARALADEIARQLILQSPAGAAEEQARSGFVQRQLEKLVANIEATESEIAAERARLDAATSARAIQQFENNIWALEDKLAGYQETYASLSQTVEGGTNYLSIIEYAAPYGPISPNVQQTVLMGAATGLGLAVGGALLIEFLDDTLKTSDDVTRALSLPTLGAIARMDGEGREDSLIVVREPRSPTAEAFRALRTNIQFSSVDKPLRTLVITSANPEEGKSTLAANLAVAMAQLGRSVALLDADMRRPKQHDVFRLGNPRGLSDALLDPKADLSTYGWKLTSDRLSRLFAAPGADRMAESDSAAGIGDLYLVTGGPIPPNPADLLGSGRMEALLERVKKQADVIILDTPPVLSVTDAIVLATRVDGVILVSDARRTRRGMVRRAVERLRQVNAPLLGVVLNRVAPAGGGYDSYQYYYGRGEKEQRVKHRPPPKSGWALPRLTFLGKLKRSGNGQTTDHEQRVATPGPAKEQH